MKLRVKHTSLAGLAAAVVLVLAGCGGVVEGQATSSLYNPSRVGGMAVTDGPSGLRPDGPAPTGAVINTDNGDIDKLATLSINDLEEYWENNYSPALPGTFRPVDSLMSYDAREHGPEFCGHDTYEVVNASYCLGNRQISWDRGLFLPIAKKFFGELAVTGVLAHEYGHALQRMANLTNPRRTSVLVAEQQADCFAGDYLRWVAEGSSTRFELSTGEGLNKVLAGLLVLRDPVLSPLDDPGDGHGTAIERISAFQLGFTSGSSACAGIDAAEIKRRQGDLPDSLKVDPLGGLISRDAEIDEELLGNAMEVLGAVYAPANPPTLTLTESPCADAEATPPVSYCPSTNTIAVDLPGLQKVGQPASEKNLVLVQGDNSALALLTSRYALAVQQGRGMPLRGAVVGLRTACLTGAAQRAMAQDVKTPSGATLVLTAGDIDEAVAGLLSNGLAASDVDGGTVPAGFTRIVAYRSGLVGANLEDCYSRFG